MRIKVLLVPLVWFVLTGCAGPASHESGEQSYAASPPRPIDRVGAGIVSVEHQFETTAQSAQAVTSGSAKRGKYSKDLKGLDASVTQLRNDAADLRQRASEYLAQWSGEKVTVTATGAVVGYTDQKRARAKAKYDEMVTAMQQARDEAGPLMAQMTELDDQLRSGGSKDSLQAKSQQIWDASAQVRAHLNDALNDLDQLKAMLNQTTR